MKRTLFPIGAFLITAFLGACSLNIEVEDPNPHGSTENPLKTPIRMEAPKIRSPIRRPFCRKIRQKLLLIIP